MSIVSDDFDVDHLLEIRKNANQLEEQGSLTISPIHQKNKKHYITGLTG